MNTIESRVQRGIELLDEHYDHEWRHAIVPSDIRMNDGGKCVLAQLFGDYVDGLKTLGLSDPLYPYTGLVGDYADDYGFQASVSANNAELAEAQKTEYQALQDEWVRRLREWSQA